MLFLKSVYHYFNLLKYKLISNCCQDIAVSEASIYVSSFLVVVSYLIQPRQEASTLGLTSFSSQPTYRYKLGYSFKVPVFRSRHNSFQRIMACPNLDPHIWNRLLYLWGSVWTCWTCCLDMLERQDQSARDPTTQSVCEPFACDYYSVGSLAARTYSDLGISSGCWIVLEGDDQQSHREDILRPSFWGVVCYVLLLTRLRPKGRGRQQ